MATGNTNTILHHQPQPTPLTPLLILLLPATLLLIHHIRKDYHAFLALGPGGTPSTPTGYLRICLLRLFALRNPLLPPTLSLPSSSSSSSFASSHPSNTTPTTRSSSPPEDTGLLSPQTLPHRRTPRPTVAGIAPHRQTTQKGTPESYAALSTALHALTTANPQTLYTDTSCFEKHSTGIFCTAAATTTTATATPTATTTPHRTCRGEVCHGHPSDGSLHLTLHPADVSVILETGWGERHPLARDEWWWRETVRVVPPGFVMVYAPRDGEELEVVMRIVRAAVWWVSGAKIEES